MSCTYCGSCGKHWHTVAVGWRGQDAAGNHSTASNNSPAQPPPEGKQAPQKAATVSQLKSAVANDALPEEVRQVARQHLHKEQQERWETMEPAQRVASTRSKVENCKQDLSAKALELEKLQLDIQKLKEHELQLGYDIAEANNELEKAEQAHTESLAGQPASPSGDLLLKSAEELFKPHAELLEAFRALLAKLPKEQPAQANQQQEPAQQPGDSQPPAPAGDVDMGGASKMVPANSPAAPIQWGSMPDERRLAAERGLAVAATRKEQIPAEVIKQGKSAKKD